MVPAWYPYTLLPIPEYPQVPMTQIIVAGKILYSTCQSLLNGVLPDFQKGLSSRTMASKRISWPTEKAQALIHEHQQQSLKRKTNDTAFTLHNKKTRVETSSTNSTSQQATLDSNSATGNTDPTPQHTDHESTTGTISRPPMDHGSPDHSEVDENEQAEAELGRSIELLHFVSESTSFSEHEKEVELTYLCLFQTQPQH